MNITSARTVGTRHRPHRFVEPLECRRLLVASLVEDINPGTGGSDPMDLTRVGDDVFFTTGALTGQHAIWRTDGTEAGTVLLRTGRSRILGSFGGKLVFSSEDAQSGTELWTSDGTPQGTALLKDVIAGPDDGFPIGELAFGQDRFFFQARTAEGSASPWRLWVSDGTPAGTVPVREFTSNLSHSSPTVLADGRALFVSGVSDLWTSDGTEAGTMPLFTEPSWAPSAVTSGFTPFNGYVYFSAFDPNFGTELWRTNGEEVRTGPIMDINPGDASSNPSNLVAVGSSKLFFLANDGYSGVELWATDGTEGGTVLPREAYPGDGGPTYSAGVAYGTAGGLAYYTLDDGESGLELWRSNGTAAGTHMVKDLTSGPGTAAFGFFTDVNGLLYFRKGNELWRTNGTEAGTVQVSLGAGVDQPLHLELSDAGLLFSARSAATGTELWKIAGPTADAGTSYRVAPDGSITLDGTGSSDPDPGESLSYVWDLDGDGRFGEFDEGALRGMELGPEPDFFAGGLAEGTYVVTLRVTNNAGLSDTATADVVVGTTVPSDTKTVLGDETEDDRWTVRYTQGNVQVFRRIGSSLVLEEEWPSVEVRELRFIGGGGDDAVSVFSTLPLTKVMLDGGDGNDTLLITSDNDNGIGGPFERLEVYGGATVLVKEDLATDVVEVAEGSRLVLEQGADLTLRTKQVVMDPLFGDRIDVGDNELVVEGGNTAAVEELMASARNGVTTRWQGPGIGTSAAATITGLSAFKRGDDVVVKYTYNGDVNGDGRVNADDYFRIDQGFLLFGVHPLLYVNGDFNFDGRVNADDYFLIDQAFLGQGAPAARGVGAVGARAVVEGAGRKRAKVRLVVETVTVRARGAMPRRSAMAGVRRG